MIWIIGKRAWPGYDEFMTEQTTASPSSIDFTRPFPDYVICPQCGEPEVEVWCFDLKASCHACGHEFAHSLPTECASTCDAESHQPRHRNLIAEE
jgi:hypothetical protein